MIWAFVSLLRQVSGINERIGLRSRSRRDGLFRVDRLDLVSARRVVQIVLATFLLYVGWRFYWFVRHFETGGATPYVDRPASVEGFLPISALVALRSWISNGVYDTIHPAGLAILLAVLLTSFLWKKGFCSWICPIGTLSEILGRLGRHLLGRNFVLPWLLDWLLMGIKYLLLLFFVKAIFIDMDGRAAAAFIQGAYNKIADVKMLYFFTQISLTALLIIAGLMVASVFISNFWCRYICPYGALLGIVSLASPLSIKRNDGQCVDCRLCDRVCPNSIDVSTSEDVRSPECTSCLNCVNICPRRGALELGLAGTRLKLHPWLYPALFLGTFFLVLAVAQLTGHWQTSLTYADYTVLIPKAPLLSH